MEERQRAGLLLTRFGLGLAAIGRPLYMTLGHDADFPQGRTVQAMEAQARDVLDTAYAAGIRYFDAARSYGRAEEFLRRWIDARGLRDAVAGSKWGYRYTGDWKLDGRVQEVKEHSAQMLRTQVAESRALLGPWLQLYQIHSASPETGVLENAEVIDDLRRLRGEGLRLGVTATGVRQLQTLRRALELRFEGAPLFSSVQATWNVLERSAEPALIEAHQAGLAVIVKEPLANGRLAPRGDVPLAREGATADAVALAFVLRQPWADVVLLGATTSAQLESNLRALDLEVADDFAALREPPDLYWSRRAALPWI
jgi:aryl-alcohol dehydrogenase-like predicted oxidoreductase